MICSGNFKEQIMANIENLLDRTVGLFKRFYWGKKQQREEEEFVGYEVFPFKYLAPQPKRKLR